MPRTAPKPVPARLNFTVPFCIMDVQSRSVRHSQNICFMVEGVELVEEMQLMIREFVEDLAKVGFQTSAALERFKESRDKPRTLEAAEAI